MLKEAEFNGLVATLTMIAQYGLLTWIYGIQEHGCVKLGQAPRRAFKYKLRNSSSTLKVSFIYKMTQIYEYIYNIKGDTLHILIQICPHFS